MCERVRFAGRPNPVRINAFQLLNRLISGSAYKTRSTTYDMGLPALIFIFALLVAPRPGLVEGTPYRRGDGGLRIPLQPRRASSERIDPTDLAGIGGEHVETRAAKAPGFTWGQGPMRGVNIGGW